MLFVLAEVVLGLFVVFLIGFVISVVLETVKLLRNPIPRMCNNDKRFSEIANKYLHEMYSIKTR